MKKQSFFAFAVAASMVFVFGSCTRYNTDDILLNETETVFTHKAPDVNFSSLTKTYAIVDKIHLIYDPAKPVDSIKFWSLYNNAVLGAVNTNLSNLGYTKVNVNQNPKLFINVSANSNVSSGAIYYPGWWWGYYPCYPYYGWYCGGYPSYPGFITTYSYKEGSFLIEMVDVAKSGSEGNPVILWFGGLTAVASSDDATNVQRAVTNTNQAFVQSPYLK